MLNFFENVLAERKGGKYESLVMIVIFVIIAIFNVIKSITKAAKENKEKQEAALRPTQMRYKPLDGQGLQEQATHNKQVHQPQVERQASLDAEQGYHQEQVELQRRKQKHQELQKLRQQQKQNLANTLKQQKLREEVVFQESKSKAVKPKVERPITHITDAEDIAEMPLEQLRQAIILREILDKPVALR